MYQSHRRNNCLRPISGVPTPGNQCVNGSEGNHDQRLFIRARGGKSLNDLLLENLPYGVVTNTTDSVFNHNSSEKKVFNFNILYIFSDVIIGHPSDDVNIEIHENNHEECF